MSSDEEEARAHQYGTPLLTLAPLTSGRFAVYGELRQILGIVSGLEEALALYRPHLAAVLASRAKARLPRRESEIDPEVAALDIEF